MNELTNDNIQTFVKFIRMLIDMDETTLTKQACEIMGVKSGWFVKEVLDER